MIITLSLLYTRVNAPSPSAFFIVAMFLIVALFACAGRGGSSPPLENRIRHLPPQIGPGAAPLIGIPGHEVNQD